MMETMYERMEELIKLEEDIDNKIQYLLQIHQEKENDEQQTEPKVN